MSEEAGPQQDSAVKKIDVVGVSWYRIGAPHPRREPGHDNRVVDQDTAAAAVEEASRKSGLRARSSWRARIEPSHYGSSDHPGECALAEPVHKF